MVMFTQVLCFQVLLVYQSCFINPITVSVFVVLSCSAIFYGPEILIDPVAV